MFRRLPAYLRLAWALWRDPEVGPGRKAMLALAASYSVSPVDLIPGFIPVAGQMDDVLVLLGGLRRALRGLPTEVRDRHLQAARLTLADLEEDYCGVRAALAALAAGAARAGGRAAAHAARLGGCVATAAARAGGRAAARATEKAWRLIRRRTP